MLALHDIHVTYPGGHPALAAVDLCLRPGEVTVFLGRSGAGKSTLLRLLNGLVVPTSGAVVVPGLGGLADRAVLRRHRRQTAMVFQQHHLIGRLSALRNVLVGRLASRGTLRSLLPWPRPEAEKALACIARVGLLDRALARVDQLSGGEQQRIGIARALAQEPTLLIADEPVASLDPASAEAVLALLRSVCAERGITAVVSLHQVDLARRFADRVIGLHRGRVVLDGPPAALTPLALEKLYAAPGDLAAPGPPAPPAPQPLLSASG